MRYDVLIYDSDNILNAADPSGNLIRIIGLTQSEADDIADFDAARRFDWLAPL